MLKELIQQGLQFESKISPKIGSSSVSTDFEHWAAQAIYYLELEFRGHTPTIEASNAYKTLRVDTGAKYRQILGCLQAAEEIKKLKGESLRCLGSEPSVGLAQQPCSAS